MRNESFKSQTEMDRRKKLDVVLRQLTDDRLTEEERCMIGKAIGYRKQYSIRLCRSPSIFLCSMSSNGGVTRVQIIFGEPGVQPQSPAAVLIHRQDTSIVYVYLPEKGE